MPPPPCPDWSGEESLTQLPDVVRGMADVHRLIIKHAKTRIIDHGDIKTWHAKVFANVVPKSYYAGNFRSDESSRPCLQVDVAVPPNPGAPFSDVPRLMRELSDEIATFTKRTDSFIGSGVTETDKARAVLQLTAFVVGKFLKIHPFRNGNGRISRLLTNYFLHRYGYRLLYENPLPRPPTPYDVASAACMTGDPTLMYEYLLVALTKA